MLPSSLNSLNILLWCSHWKLWICSCPPCDFYWMISEMNEYSCSIKNAESPWIPVINLTYMRCSEDIQNVSWTSYTSSIYVPCPQSDTLSLHLTFSSGKVLLKVNHKETLYHLGSCLHHIPSAWIYYLTSAWHYNQQRCY